MSGGIILHQQRPYRLTQFGPDPSGAGCPDRTVQQVGTTNQRKQNGWYGVPALIHCWRALGGGVYTAADRSGTILSGASLGGELDVRSVSWIWRQGRWNPTARPRTVRIAPLSRRQHFPHWNSVYLGYPFIEWPGTSGVQWGSMGAGDGTYQPPGSLHAPQCAGHDTDSGGRELPPPLLTGL